MQSQQTALLAVVGVALGITTVAVLLRMYVRIWLLGASQLADYLMIATQATFIVGNGLVIQAIYWGVGLHLSETSAFDRSHAPQIYVGCELMYVINTLLLRLAICAQLWKIGKQINSARSRLYRNIIIGFAGIITTASIVVFFVIIFHCNPPSYFWDKFGDEDAPGYCWSPQAFAAVLITHAMISGLADIILGLLPVFMLAKTKMRWRDRATVSLLLGNGCLAGVAAFVRIPYMITLIYQLDFFYNCIPLVITSVIEPCIGITTASIATFRPLIRKVRNSTSASKSHSRNRSASATRGPTGKLSRLGNTIISNKNSSSPNILSSTSTKVDLASRDNSHSRPSSGDSLQVGLRNSIHGGAAANIHKEQREFGNALKMNPWRGKGNESQDHLVELPRRALSRSGSKGSRYALDRKERKNEYEIGYRLESATWADEADAEMGLGLGGDLVELGSGTSDGTSQGSEGSMLPLQRPGLPMNNMGSFGGITREVEWEVRHEEVKRKGNRGLDVARTRSWYTGH